MAIERFCPKCGKKGITGEFCDDCNASEIDIEIDDMTICASCKKYLLKNKWIKFSSLKEAIQTYIKNHFKKKSFVSITPHIPEHNPNAGLEIDVDNDVIFQTEKYNLSLKVKYTLCPNCSKKGSQYFEGVLQIRNSKPSVEKFFLRLAKAEEIKGVYVNDIKKSPNGKDFYITKKNYIKKFALRLQERFGGIVKTSAKLFSRNAQTSKDIYRVNILIEIPKLDVGDLFEQKDHLYKVLRHSKRMKVQDLILDKTTSFEYKNIDYLPVKTFKTHITKTRPRIEILDKDYQSVPIRNFPKVKIGQKVRVAKFNDEYLVI